MTDWFRSWHGAPTDPKWRTIAKRAAVSPSLVVAIAWALMDRASQADERGSIEGLDVETLADFLDCSVDDIERVIQAMRDKCVLTDARFAAWEKRQPKRERDETPSTERVRAHREREKLNKTNNAVSDDMEPRNATIESETPRNDVENIETPRNAMEHHGTHRAEQSRAEENREEAAQLSRAAAQKRIEPHDDGPDRFAEAERACHRALGNADIADPSFGPIMLLIDRGFRLRDIITVLRSEAPKPRKKPIRSWTLWADIVAERLAAAPKSIPKIENPADPRIEFPGGVRWPESTVRQSVADWKTRPHSWPYLIGPPPDDPGCLVPRRILDEILQPQAAA